MILPAARDAHERPLVRRCVEARLRAFAPACRSINGLALADAHAISCHEITFSNREDDDEAA
jgi:hypothetical protein